MTRLRFFLFTVAILAGCGKDDPPEPAFTAPDGKWVYTTPEKGITVEFELVSASDGSSVSITNASITVSGTSGTTGAQMTDVDLPVIGMIRINANDAALTYPYSIQFNTCTIGADFKNIFVTDVQYTYPWGTLKTVTGISIPRKP